MKPFEFVLVAISVLFGLALSEFANLVALMIKNYSVSTFSLPYLCVMLIGIAGGLNYWTTVYLLRNIDSWNNLKVGLLFTTGLTYYVIARVCFPDVSTFNHNYVQLYHEVIGIGFSMMCLWIAFIVVEAVVLKKGRPKRWYVMMALFILLLLSGVFVTNKAYREGLAYVFVLMQALNLAINRVTISEPTNA